MKNPAHWFFLLVAILVGLSVSLSPTSPPPENSAPSTYNADLPGHRALFNFLQTLGAPIERWEEDYSALEGEGQVLFLSQHPSSTVAALSSEEITQLLHWIRRGNTVIISGDYRRDVSGRQLLQELGFGVERVEDPWWLPTMPNTARPDGLALTSTNHLPTSFQSGVLVMSWCRPLPPHPDLEIWWRGVEGAYAGQLTCGRGRLILCASATWLNQEWLEVGANLEFLHWLFNREGNWPRRLWFDEAHQGFRPRYAALALWEKPGIRLLSLELLLVLVFFLAGSVRRIGPIRARPQVYSQGREQVEFLAGLYERGHALDALREKLAIEAGLSASEVSHHSGWDKLVARHRAWRRAHRDGGLHL